MNKTATTPLPVRLLAGLLALAGLALIVVLAGPYVIELGRALIG